MKMKLLLLTGFFATNTVFAVCEHKAKTVSLKLQCSKAGASLNATLLYYIFKDFGTDEKGKKCPANVSTLIEESPDSAGFPNVPGIGFNIKVGSSTIKTPQNYSGGFVGLSDTPIAQVMNLSKSRLTFKFTGEQGIGYKEGYVQIDYVSDIGLLDGQSVTVLPMIGAFSNATAKIVGASPAGLKGAICPVLKATAGAFKPI